jgi:hypothetical protein
MSLTILNTMHIHLWRNKALKQWRWTMTSPVNRSVMESGNSHELAKALEDVRKTIEWMMEQELLTSEAD